MMWIVFSIVLLLMPRLAAAATCNASNLSTFNSCMASTSCGDEIVLAANTYNNFEATINKNCTTGTRLTVRGANATGTILSGNGTKLILQGNGINVKWFNITAKNSGDLEGGVQFKGARFYRFTENTFKNSSGLSTGLVLGAFNVRDTEDIEIDNNTFENLSITYAIRIYVSTNATRGHSKRVTVHHNTFRDIADRGASESVFEIGEGGLVGATLAADTIWEHNLFQRIKGHWGTFHPKASNVFIKNNTFIDTFGFISRAGSNHQYTDNYFEATSGYIPDVGNGGVWRINTGGTTIARNIVRCANAQCDYIVDCEFGTGDGGDHHYETCKNLTIEDNTFHNASVNIVRLGSDKNGSSNDGPRTDPPHDLTVRRNHFVGTAGELVLKHADVTQNIVIQDNHYYWTSPAIPGLQGVGSSTGNPNYISTTAGAVGAYQSTVSPAIERGAIRGPFISSCAVDSTATNVNKITWSTGYSPLVSVTPTNIDTTVTVAGTPTTRNTTAVAIGTPTRTDATFDGAAVTAGNIVTMVTQQNAIRNTQCIGGDLGNCMNGINLATTSVRQCTNNTGEFTPQPGWMLGTTRSIAAGSNRLLLVAGCQEVVTVPGGATPISFTGCTYGGQAMTHVGTANVNESPTGSEVMASLWSLKETGIAAATGTSIVCTPEVAAESGRPVIIASGVYTGVTQATSPGTPQTDTELTGTNVTTANLATNTGIAVQLACAGAEGTWAPGSGWTEQIDTCEDTGCGTRMHVADRITSAAAVAGDATFTTSQSSFTNRLAMVAVPLAGTSSQEPGGVATRTQTASRCAFHNAPGWQGPQDTACTIVPGHQLAVVGEYHVTGHAETVPVGKQLNCCWSNCELVENFWPVDDAGTNGVRYAPSGLIPHGLLIDSRQLTGAACTHVNGAYITRDSMFPQALAVGECSTFGYILEFLITVDPDVTPTLTCTMALDDNTAFAPGVRTTINVRKGDATGQ